MPELKPAMLMIMKVYEKYAGPDGSLSKGEMRRLLEKEFPEMSGPAMLMIMKVSEKYAGSDGSLTKGEMRRLLEKEFPEMSGNCKDEDALKELMKDVDENEDGSVSFDKFLILLSKTIIFQK
ncbi:protein S100-P-like [Discoglossus pictus]